MLIDIHSHLDHHFYKEDIDAVIGRAEEANVKVILTAGINPQTNRESLALAKKYDMVKPCLGIYPVQTLQKEIEQANYPLPFSPFDIDEEIAFIKKHGKQIAAVGEIGLDYHWTRDYAKEQEILFEKMASLAEELGKPIVVHSRKAEQECISFLESTSIKKIVMHCFSGKKNLVKKIVDNGWYLTAPTSIGRNPQFQENVSLTPITQLFCETDAPYLSPWKEKRNEPAFIIEAYKKVAEIKKMEVEEVIKNMWMNWQRVFL